TAYAPAPRRLYQDSSHAHARPRPARRPRTGARHRAGHGHRHPARERRRHRPAAGAAAPRRRGGDSALPCPLHHPARGALALAPANPGRWFPNLGVEKSWGTADSRSSLTLATGGTFNRVEGLPVVFGPLFDWKIERNVRFRVDALGVFRTAGDFTDKRSDLGYMVRTALRAGEVPAYGLEFRAYAVVAPVAAWGLRGAATRRSTTAITPR